MLTLCRYGDRISKLYKPFILSLTDDFTDDNNETFSIDEVLYEKPLGSDVLILDVDNRVGNEDAKLGASENIDINDMDYLSAGVLNHYLYGMPSYAPVHVMEPKANPGTSGNSWL